MAQKKRTHSGSRKNAGTAADEFSGRKIHKDWRVWVIVGMMIAAMAVYVLTLDDSIVPAIMR